MDGAPSPGSSTSTKEYVRVISCDDGLSTDEGLVIIGVTVFVLGLCALGGAIYVYRLRNAGYREVRDDSMDGDIDFGDVENVVRRASAIDDNIEMAPISTRGRASKSSPVYKDVVSLSELQEEVL